MASIRKFTAIIEREGDRNVAPCPDLDIARRGPTIEAAKANLAEAVTQFVDAADRAEIQRRLHRDIFVTRLEVAVG